MTDAVKRRGRPPKNSVAMSATERQQQRRQRQAEFEQRALAAEEALSECLTSIRNLRHYAIQLDVEFQAAIKGKPDFKRMRRFMTKVFACEEQASAALIRHAVRRSPSS